MTRDEIDVMWQQALHQSVQDGEQFTRYRFAALVAANALELADKRIAELERNEGGGCTLAGPGRGDCEHYVGLQDGAVDAYGKPNGWCWSCWKSRRIAELAKFHAELHVEHGKAKIRIGELECKLAVARGACKDIRRAIERECYAAAYIIVSEALAQIGGEDAR